MRIAFVPAARVLSDREPNGEGLIATTLLRALRDRGHEVIAYCERADADLPGIDVRPISADGPTAALGRVAFARRIAADVATVHADVLHTLFPFTTADGYAFASGAPLVVGPVNLPWPRSRTSLPLHARITDAYEHWLHTRTLARADRILVTGDSSRAALRSIGARATEVPFGVDVSRFVPLPYPTAPVVAFCSTLAKRKGAHVLLAAIPLVRACFPAVRFVVAGPDEGGFAEQFVAAGADYVGVLAPGDVPDLFARAAIVCQPSFGEPFGMTVVEAMAAGRPVVGTDAGGLPDAIAHNSGGLLVAPGDARGLAAALCELLIDRDTAQKMGVFNRARVVQRHALDRVVDRIEDAYADVVKGRSHVTAA